MTVERHKEDEKAGSFSNIKHYYNLVLGDKILPQYFEVT